MSTLFENAPPLVAREWESRRDAHEQRIAGVLVEHQRRQSRGERHPVLDFLFRYYSFRAARLRRWSPGIGAWLEGDDAGPWPRFARPAGDRPASARLWLDPGRFPKNRIESLRWIIRFLEDTRDRSPRFSCYGLHEWAMVYRLEKVRHDAFRLRVSDSVIEEVLHTQGLRCTHFDAFRFFTPAARPLNPVSLTRDDRMEMDQPGCLHVNMDLYKWGYKMYPWIPGELLLDLFAFAVRVREVDMRASPYDLRELGYEPIPIETEDGRAVYRHEQVRIAEEAQPLRSRLLQALHHVAQRVEPV